MGRGRNVIPLVLTLGVVSLPAWLNLDALRFRSADPFNVPGLLATVFLLALFQERAMEVFVTTWRGPDAEALEQLRDTCAAALDVLLIGGLIGGGSEGIHKLAMVYADFLDSTSRRMKAA